MTRALQTRLNDAPNAEELTALESGDVALLVESLSNDGYRLPRSVVVAAQPIEFSFSWENPNFRWYDAVPF